ncbi:TetR/AcrR family transcriptional regulator [Desulfuribacillus alkaliarsenatis]|uniref:HTH tetR-type domain-containing protein n=1 Tax=Desulfuribacillus alkaliarsenatis TaxID=766136 RepID=A0A1E5FZB6_9FIRM|nr:TetR/AcrR family transcriptional regulator [Desulfuribacillus alkaliarsenatis]OEF95842.1 hypothetical protein BHF68_10625 [Desulfuribacillus alkaliarsenatis]
MQKSKTREKIIEVAKEMFQEQGYVHSTTKEIARRADVNEVTIFRHFGSKENLFNEVMGSITTVAVFNDEFEKQFIGNLREDLTLFANTYIESACERIMLLNLGLMDGPRDPEMGRLVGQIALRITGFLADYLNKLHENGIIPNNDFYLTSQMMYSVLYHYVISNYSMSGAKNIMQVDKATIVKECVEMFYNKLMNGK